MNDMKNATFTKCNIVFFSGQRTTRFRPTPQGYDFKHVPERQPNAWRRTETFSAIFSLTGRLSKILWRLHDSLDYWLDAIFPFFQFDNDINDVIKNGASFKILTEKLAQYQGILRLIEAELHRTLHVGRYEVKLDRLKSFLEERVTSIIDLILKEFSRLFADSATE